jgi:hypothetical protein
MQFDILQKLFASYIYDDEQSIVSEILVKNGTCKTRLNIYKNNVLQNLINALKTTYPAVLAEVEEQDFNLLARQYIKTYKPTSGDLNDYGGHMDELIFSRHDNIPLAELAKLEWLYHLVFFAEDAKAMDVTSLANIPAESYEQLKFSLHPSVRLMKSPYPVYQIWKSHKDNELFNDEEEDSYNYLIYRKGFLLQTIQLPLSDFIFISSLKKGDALYEAYLASSQEDEAFDLMVTIHKLVMDGVITGVTY